MPHSQSPAALADPDRNLPVPRQSHIISTVLSPAVGLWLRSQVEHVEDLALLIEGGDRQLLTGLVPRVTVTGRNVIYQGLYLSTIQLIGRGIKINFGQILRGKPLQLSRTVPVQAEVVFTQDDLNDSLQSPLLIQMLTEVLATLLNAGAAPTLYAPDSNQPVVLDHFRAKIEPGRLTLGASIISATQGTAKPFILRTGLRITSGRELRLDAPEWLPTPKSSGVPLHDLDDFPIDLGNDIDLHDLVLEYRQLTCRGRFNILP